MARQPCASVPATLQAVGRALYGAFGPQHWWPGETPFEVMVGAVLTQNTNWGNVERAIAQLKTAGLLHPRALARCPRRRLARLIRSSGYFNVKARRLHELVAWLAPRLDEKNDVVASLRPMRTPKLRAALLEIPGVGPETADSILLYALNRRVFVVDAYTRRFLSRHGLIAARASYEQIRALFEENLPRSRKLYNEYHALIVRLGKEICLPRPRCDACPLRPLLGLPEPNADFGLRSADSRRRPVLQSVIPNPQSAMRWTFLLLKRLRRGVRLHWRSARSVGPARRQLSQCSGGAT